MTFAFAAESLVSAEEGDLSVPPRLVAVEGLLAAGASSVESQGGALIPLIHGGTSGAGGAFVCLHGGALFGSRRDSNVNK